MIYCRETKNKTQVSLVPGYCDNQPVLEDIPCHCLTLLFITKTRFAVVYFSMMLFHRRPLKNEIYLPWNN